MGPAATTLRRGVKLVSAATDALLPRVAGLTILLYHRVGAGTASEVDLPVSLFEAQVEYLAATGRVVSFDHGLRLAERRAHDVAQPIVMTFDDGTDDVVDIAVPILARHELPALLYVATGFVEEGRAFPDGGRPASWNGLADAVAGGVLQLGSHTHDHLLLDRVSVPSAAHQLDRSIDLLRTHAGVDPEHFAYPKARPATGQVAREVAARFRTAAVAGGGVNRLGHTDPQRLARAPIQRSDGMRWFRRKVDGGLTLEGHLRHLASGPRYARSAS